MGLINKKKTSGDSGAAEIKQYIQGAGACIVTKSLLAGESNLKWMYREDNGIGNGWVAFGDTDTQEYIEKAENLQIVDFNTLANIEPAVLNILYMPIGADLEFCSDKSGKYFIDTKTGEEIREPVKHPAQLAFEKNLKFLNQESYPADFFQGLFRKSEKIETIVAGEADFPSGEVVLADPLTYLGQEKYQVLLDRKIPVGSYPVELSVLHSRIAGIRIAAARLKISDKISVSYERAEAKGEKAFPFMGVDAGLGCFSDAVIAKEYNGFLEEWYKANEGKNIYDDYFAALFQKSYETYPQLQREGGDFLSWQLPGTGHRLVMFASGMGDGIYTGYRGLDAEGEIAELVIPFINPEYF